ncbi:hypothetical protein ACW5W4_04315 [Aeromonas crassostreae]
MTRTIDALKLIVEELEEHSNRLSSIEERERISAKVADHQSREIDQLKIRVRDMEIREKSRTGTPKKSLAEEYKLSPGRISQITKTH